MIKELSRPAKIILAREALLVSANEAYHNDTPMLTDCSYDAVWREHEHDRKEYPSYWDGDDYLFGDAGSILDKVGAAPVETSGFTKVKHGNRMLSINDVFEGDGASQYDELLGFVRDMEKKLGNGAWPMRVEAKVDGLAVKVIYRNGMLSTGITRGNGEVGDDVTENLRISGIVPQSIRPDKPWDGTQADPLNAEHLEIAGEVFMPVEAFHKANEERAAKGLQLWANPRNAASGSLKLQDPEELKTRPLAFVRHDGYSPFIKDILGVGGVDVFNWESLLVAIEDVRNSTCPYATDGAVVKLENLGARAVVGNGTRAPNWACAFKFKPEQVTTKLLDIAVQVGRTGALTPVAVMEPVLVDGTTVCSATLHNEEHIRNLGLQIGDEVLLQKAGMIIPEIAESLTHRRLRDELTRELRVTFPNDSGELVAGKMTARLESQRPPFDLVAHIDGKCPSCGSTGLQKQQVAGEDGARWMCGNVSACPAQMAAQILHACSRKCLDIEGIGEEVANALARTLSPRLNAFDVICELVTGTIAINLEPLQWTTAAGGTMTFGASRTAKALAAGQRAKSLPLNRWLCALGIHTVGENTSKEISRLCADIPGLVSMVYPATGIAMRIEAGEDKTSGDLARYAISSHLGPASAAALTAYFRTEVGEYVMARLREWGVKSDNYDPEPKASDDKPLFGKTFAITGTLSVGRDEMKALIEASGGKVSGSVSKKTNYLVAGEGGGQKADKARAAGVLILDEAAVREML